jgi:hypothetical protein
MKAPGGIAFTDGDGVAFDTTLTKLLLADGTANVGLLLDPAVIKFPNGEVACYIGGTPLFNQPGVPKIVAAWAQKTTSVEQESSGRFPVHFELLQNYPNPFFPHRGKTFSNPGTTIRFVMPQPERVTLKVFTALGEEVATLVNENLNTGMHAVGFDAKGLPGGVYFYRLQAGSCTAMKKMLVIF